ncbi:hypothetical protein CVS40_5182 [Lucilia cuprina]|nr:hypothetical protein CVS40_5182 [Lucilia cuprina]
MGEEATSHDLQNTFKPLTEPLQKLVKLSNEGSLKLMKPKVENLIKLNKSLQESFTTSTPKKRIMRREFFENDFDNKENDEYLKEPEHIYHEDGETDQDDTFYSQPDDNDIINLSLLKSKKKLDEVYGPHKVDNGQWKFGKENLKVSAEKIIVGNQHWAYTPGLFELLFYKKPSNYDTSELEIYKKILLNTNAYRVNFNPNGKIKANKGTKYKEIIKKLIHSTHTGQGLMKVNFVRRRVIMKGIDDLWQADLVEMWNYSKFNNGYRFILTIIDTFS